MRLFRKRAKGRRRGGIARCPGGCQRISPARADGPDSDLYLCARCHGYICLECTRPVEGPLMLCGKCLKGAAPFCTTRELFPGTGP